MSFEKEKKIVGDLRKLSEEKSTQYEMVNNKQGGCLPSLILFLHHQNLDIVKESLEAIKNLSECVNNRSLMIKETALLDSLHSFTTLNNQNTQILQLASTILKNLSSNNLRTPNTIQQNNPLHNKLNNSIPKPVSNNPINNFNSSQRPTTGLRPETKGIFFNSNNKPQQQQQQQNKTVTLQIDYNCNKKEEQERKRKNVEEALLSVRGVISFTYDSSADRFVIRIRKEISVDVLFDAVLDSDYMINVAHVVKTPDGKEITIKVPKPQQPLRLSQRESSLLRLSNEVVLMIFTYITPNCLIMTAASCKTLFDFCSQDIVWSTLAKYQPSCKWLLKENENLMSCYCQRMSILKETNKAWKMIQRFHTLDLNDGLTEEQVEINENILGFRLPINIRLSFMLYNGQNKSCNSPLRQITPIGRFLPLQEIIEEITERPHPSLFPLTTEAGFQQWFASLDGAIYLKSGWNEIKKSDNWTQFLYSLCS